jgi:hypothetical protein
MADPKSKQGLLLIAEAYERLAERGQAPKKCLARGPTLARRGKSIMTTTTTDILQANEWPDGYGNSIERVLYLLERHDEIELPRIVAAVFEARGSKFSAGQVRRAIARVEQGA